MKKLTVNLSSLFLITVLSMVSLNSFSQKIRLSKDEKKAVKDSEMMATFQLMDTLVEQKGFVLEADYLQNQYGDQIIVTPILNFIKLDASHVVLQTGSNTNTGYNGVGGITAEGKLMNYKISKNLKNFSHTVRFSVTTNSGTYDIFMRIGPQNHARATITGLSRGKLIYNGRIESLSSAGIYKGREFM